MMAVSIYLAVSVSSLRLISCKCNVYALGFGIFSQLTFARRTKSQTFVAQKLSSLGLGLSLCIVIVIYTLGMSHVQCLVVILSPMLLNSN